MATRKIMIMRKEPTGFLPKTVLAESRMYISSVFVNRQPLKGLTNDQEQQYLVDIVDVRPDHVEWPRQVKKYWTEMSITVPFGGVELDISTTSDGEPMNIEDWIRYKWILKHPHVALNKDDMTGQKRFFIADAQRELRSANNKIQTMKDADREFIKLADSKEDMRRVYRMIGTINPDS